MTSYIFLTFAIISLSTYLIRKLEGNSKGTRRKLDGNTLTFLKGISRHLLHVYFTSVYYLKLCTFIVRIDNIRKEKDFVFNILPETTIWYVVTLSSPVALMSQATGQQDHQVINPSIHEGFYGHENLPPFIIRNLTFCNTFAHLHPNIIV